MKIVVILLVILLAFFQYKLWFAKEGVVQTLHLRKVITLQEQKNTEIKDQNKILKDDILNLKKAGGAVEAHARSDLGMVKEGEVFYQIIDAPKSKK